MTIRDFLRLTRDTDNPILRYPNFRSKKRRFPLVTLPIVGFALIGFFAKVWDIDLHKDRNEYVGLMTIMTLLVLILPYVLMRCFLPRKLESGRMEELLLSGMSKDEVFVGVIVRPLSASCYVLIPLLLVAFCALLLPNVDFRSNSLSTKIYALASWIASCLFTMLLCLDVWASPKGGLLAALGKELAFYGLRFVGVFGMVGLSFGIGHFAIEVVASVSLRGWLDSNSTKFVASGLFSFVLAVSIPVVLFRSMLRSAPARLFAEADPDGWKLGFWGANLRGVPERTATEVEAIRKARRVALVRGFAIPFLILLVGLFVAAVASGALDLDAGNSDEFEVVISGWTILLRALIGWPVVPIFVIVSPVIGVWVLLRHLPGGVALPRPGGYTRFLISLFYFSLPMLIWSSIFALTILASRSNTGSDMIVSTLMPFLIVLLLLLGSQYLIYLLMLPKRGRTVRGVFLIGISCVVYFWSLLTMDLFTYGSENINLFLTGGLSYLLTLLLLALLPLGCLGLPGVMLQRMHEEIVGHAAEVTER